MEFIDLADSVLLLFARVVLYLLGLALHVALVQRASLLLEPGCLERRVISDEMAALIGAGAWVDPLGFRVLLFLNVALPNVFAILLERLRSQEVVSLCVF